MDNKIWQVDMLIHGGYYFVVCMLILLLRFKIKPTYIGLALFVFSILLELLQNFSYHRSVSMLDILSNLLGIGLAVGAFWKGEGKKGKRRTFDECSGY